MTSQTPEEKDNSHHISGLGIQYKYTTPVKVTIGGNGSSDTPEETKIEETISELHLCELDEKKVRNLVHHQLQKAREQRKGWKGYVAVDPKADNYKYSPVFSDRKGAELWVKGKEISGLEVVEVDILLVDHSELDQDNLTN